MRLTCPNCDAQYEVDDRAIPDAGRDVQCSNCGHAWFQLPPHVEEAMEDEAATFGDAAAKPADEPEPEYAAAMPPSPPAAPEPAATATVVPQPMPERPAPPPPVEPRRQVLDENVQAVLREEAEREKRVRDAERGAIETQPDLGLTSPERVTTRRPAPPPARDRTAPPPAPDDEDMDEDDDSDLIASPRSARRALLPDIEQINSTLRATTERGRAAPPTPAEEEAEQRRGFRLGFRTVVLVALVLVVLYVTAPTIEARWPVSAPVLKPLVAGLDSARTLLDRLLTSAVSLIRGHG
ncbi:MAG: hypothetical protein GC186_18670 [Rhodobacteraceae bacterium]|nr:hypothetical protein [Paracoccaceae bacterium]